MDPHDPLTRDSEHPKRIRRTEILLRREREPREILETAAVVWVDARLVEPLLVEVDVLVGVPERPPQTLELERRHLIAGRHLDRIEISLVRSKVKQRHAQPARGVPFRLVVREE